MLRDHTLAVLGAGNIGRALVGGLLRGDDLPADQIRATRRSASGLDDLRERLPGVHVTTDNAEAVREATIVLVTVKPQNVADPKKGNNPTNQHRKKPGDTGGNDLSQGSEGVTKETPSA